MIFERMSFALLHILHIFEDKYKDMIQFLVIIFDKEALMLESFNEFTK